MGKGFNNYMCKKFFHPASIDNLKRVWMAQQKAETYKKKQEELRLQYEKEQEVYENKALLTKGDNRDKLSLNFMYEAPPGARQREKEDGEPEYKFEWQRKYNAPREDYCKNDESIRDQPFGILVRNVRCIKCKKWGHINTDKECSLYNIAVDTIEPTTSMDPAVLMRQMRDDGLALKAGLVDGTLPPQSRELLLSSDEEDEDAEMKFLKSLSTKDKLRLLKKLEKMEKHRKKKRREKNYTKDKKHSDKKKKHKRRHDSDSSDSEVNSKKKKHASNRLSSKVNPKRSHNRDSSDSGVDTKKKRHDSDSEDNRKVRSNHSKKSDSYRKKTSSKHGGYEERKSSKQ